MSRNFDGLSLQNEFAGLMSDTSSDFKSVILGLMNDVQLDICTRFEWAFLRQKGKKVLTANSEQQELSIGSPDAPTVVIAAGGSLTSGSDYKVLVTFYESVSGVESVAGQESSKVTATGANATITVTGIAVSGDPLVTARKVYLIKDSGDPLLYSTISDNTTTTASITVDSSSTIEAPDYTYFNKLSGSPFFEANSSSLLHYKPIDQLRLMYQGAWSTGTPEYWSDIEQTSILLQPYPSTADTLSFYYYKNPSKIYAASDSFPTIPAWLKPVLKAGVIAYAYEYRDRSGTQQKFQNYHDMLIEYILKMGQNKKLATRVRDVNGDADGFIV